MDRIGFQVANPIFLTVFKEMIELRTIALEIVAGIKNFTEGVLHGGHVFPDGNLATNEILQVWRSREMVCMDVCLDDPFHFQLLLFDIPNDRLRTPVIY